MEFLKGLFLLTDIAISLSFFSDLCLRTVARIRTSLFSLITTGLFPAISTFTLSTARTNAKFPFGPLTVFLKRLFLLTGNTKLVSWFCFWKLFATIGDIILRGMVHCRHGYSGLLDRLSSLDDRGACNASVI